MKRNPLPFLISPHSEIDGKLNDEINVQAAREYARRRCNQTQTRNQNHPSNGWFALGL